MNILICFVSLIVCVCANYTYLEYPEDESIYTQKGIRLPRQAQSQRISQAKCHNRYISDTQPPRRSPAIVGGTKTYPGEFPFMAAIGWKEDSGNIDYRCGGTLVALSFVITAAHCASVRNALLLLVVVSVNGQNRGRSYQCRVHYNGQIGICRRYSDCPGAQAVYQYYGIRPSICAAGGNNPVVCCPQTTARRQPQPQRRTQPQRQSQPQRQAQRQPQPQPQPRRQQPPVNNNVRTQRISQQKCHERYAATRTKRQIPLRTIVGGVPTAPGEFSFMAAVGWQQSNGNAEYNCGGFLIDKSFVITAAHCTSARGVKPDVVQVGGGSLNDKDSPVVPISSIIVHPSYSPRQSYHDIAIIKLSFGISNLPACLYPVNQINYQDVTAIGYGLTQFAGAKSNDLLKANLRIFSNAECQRHYPPGDKLASGVVSYQMCAGDPNRAKDTCQGDSGGPIVIKANLNGKVIPYALGITSFGQACAGSAPSIYTRISSYLDWIESVVWSGQ